MLDTHPKNWHSREKYWLATPIFRCYMLVPGRVHLDMDLNKLHYSVKLTVSLPETMPRKFQDFRPVIFQGVSDIYLDLDPTLPNWFLDRVSINHPLGFNWHPLEGAGMYICILHDWLSAYLDIQLSSFRWVIEKLFSAYIYPVHPFRKVPRNSFPLHVSIYFPNST